MVKSQPAHQCQDVKQQKSKRDRFRIAEPVKGGRFGASPAFPLGGKLGAARHSSVGASIFLTKILPECRSLSEGSGLVRPRESNGRFACHFKAKLWTNHRSSGSAHSETTPCPFVPLVAGRCCGWLKISALPLPSDLRQTLLVDPPADFLQTLAQTTLLGSDT